LESGAGKRVRVLLYGLCTGLLSYVSRKESTVVSTQLSYAYGSVLRV
jgi:hypothetical protein